MKHNILLLALIALGCNEDPNNCEGMPEKWEVSSYTCTPEQSKEVKELTKNCKEKLTRTTQMAECFENSVFITCTLKEPRCRPIVKATEED